ncbi:tetratricopeptide repeat protein [Polyangium jinanense]|nr:tetratricopeptide repeat protein [Polyangium jinanense]
MSKAKDNPTSFAPAGAGKTAKPKAPRRASREPEREREADVAVATTKKTSARRERAKAPTKKRPARPKSVLAEDMLRRALEATTPRSRALWARRGLATRAQLDRTTQAMLLRQLYLAYYEECRFAQAAAIAEQALTLDVLPDVAHQDAARAKQALGDVEGAAAHLRLAARIGPASRKAFHYWTLGSLFYLHHRYAEAIAAMSRAARWGTTDKPLYHGHLALARIALGQTVEGIGDLIDRLLVAPAGNGYGRFVLGFLALHAGRPDDARRWLEAFVDRTMSGRRAAAVALRGEVEVARQALARLPAD